jgi:hypothetical protein
MTLMGSADVNQKPAASLCCRFGMRREQTSIVAGYTSGGAGAFSQARKGLLALVSRFLTGTLFDRRDVRARGLFEFGAQFVTMFAAFPIARMGGKGLPIRKWSAGINESLATGAYRKRGHQQEPGCHTCRCEPAAALETLHYFNIQSNLTRRDTATSRSFRRWIRGYSIDLVLLDLALAQDWICGLPLRSKNYGQLL